MTEEKSKEMQVQLHIAEYNALTTRCTYFTNIQNILLSALVVWVTSGLLLYWDHEPIYLFRWGIMFGMQAIAIISGLLFHEENNMIRYMETELKQKIKDLIKNDLFWNYQSFLAKERKRNEHYIRLQYSGVWIAGALIIIIIGTRIHSWDLKWDSIGLIINFILLLLYFNNTRMAVQTQKKFWTKV